MSATLLRALTNAMHMLEQEARRRRLLLFGGAEAIEAEAKIIRDNLHALSRVDEVTSVVHDTQTTQFPFSPCHCTGNHCRGEPHFGQFCKQARSSI